MSSSRKHQCSYSYPPPSPLASSGAIPLQSRPARTGKDSVAGQALPHTLGSRLHNPAVLWAGQFIVGLKAQVEDCPLCCDPMWAPGDGVGTLMALSVGDCGHALHGRCGAW